MTRSLERFAILSLGCLIFGTLVYTYSSVYMASSSDIIFDEEVTRKDDLAKYSKTQLQEKLLKALQTIKKSQECISEAKHENQTLEKERSDAQRVVEQLQSDLQAANGANDKLKAQVQSLEVQNQQLLTQNGDLQSTIQELKQDNNKMQEHIQAMKSSINENSTNQVSDAPQQNSPKHAKAKPSTKAPKGRKSMQSDQGSPNCQASEQPPLPPNQPGIPRSGELGKRSHSTAEGRTRRMSATNAEDVQKALEAEATPRSRVEMEDPKRLAELRQLWVQLEGKSSSEQALINRVNGLRRENVELVAQLEGKRSLEGKWEEARKIAENDWPNGQEKVRTILLGTTFIPTPTHTRSTTCDTDDLSMPPPPQPHILNNARIEELEQALKAEQGKVQEEIQRCADVQSSLESTQNELSQAHSRVSQREAELQSVTGQIDALHQDMELSREGQDALQAQLAQALTAQSEAKQAEQSLAAQCEMAESRANENAAEREAAEQLAEELSKAVEVHAVQCSELSEQVAVLVKEKQQLQAELDSTNGQVAGLESQVASAKELIAGFEEQLNSVQGLYKTLSGSYEQLLEQGGQFSEQIQGQGELLSTTSRKWDEAKAAEVTALVELQDKLDAAENKLAEAESARSQLQQFKKQVVAHLGEIAKQLDVIKGHGQSDVDDDEQTEMLSKLYELFDGLAQPNLDAAQQLEQMQESHQAVISELKSVLATNSQLLSQEDEFKGTVQRLSSDLKLERATVMALRGDNEKQSSGLAELEGQLDEIEQLQKELDAQKRLVEELGADRTRAEDLQVRFEGLQATLQRVVDVLNKAFENGSQEGSSLGSLDVGQGLVEELESIMGKLYSQHQEQLGVVQSQMSQQQEELSSRINELVAQVEQSTGAEGEWQVQQKALEDKVGVLAAQLTSAQELETGLRECIQQLDQSLESQLSQSVTFMKQVEQLVNEEADDVQSASQQQQQQGDANQQQRAALLRQVDNLQSKASRLHTLLEQLQGMYSNEKSKSLELQNEGAQVQERVLVLQQSMNESQVGFDQKFVELQGVVSQSQAAEQEAKLDSQEARSQLSTMSGRVEELQREIEQLREAERVAQNKIDELQTSLAEQQSLSEQLQEKENALNQAQTKLDELDQGLQAAQVASASSQKQQKVVEELQGKVQLLEQSLDVASTQQKSTVDQLTAAEEQIEEARTRLKQSEQENEQMAQQNQELREQVLALQTSVDEAQAKTSSMQSLIDGHGQQLAEAESSAQAAIQEMEQKVAHAEEQFAATNEDREQLQKQLDAVNSLLQETQQQVQENQSDRVEQLERQIATLSQRAAELEHELKGAAEARAQAEAGQKQIEQLLAALQKAQTAGSGAQDGAKSSEADNNLAKQKKVLRVLKQRLDAREAECKQLQEQLAQYQYGDGTATAATATAGHQPAQPKPQVRDVAVEVDIVNGSGSGGKSVCDKSVQHDTSSASGQAQADGLSGSGVDSQPSQPTMIVSRALPSILQDTDEVQNMGDDVIDKAAHQAEVDQLKKEAAEAKSKFMAVAKKKQAEYNQSLTNLRNKLQSTEAELAGLKQDGKAVVSDFEQKLAEAASTQGSLEAQLAQFQIDNESATQSERQARAEAEQLKAQWEAAEAARKELADELAKAQSSLREAQQQVDDTKKQLQEQHDKMQELSAAASVSEQNEQNRAREQEAERSKLRKAVGELKRQLERRAAALKGKEEEVGGLKQQVESKENELQAAKDEAEQLQLRISSYEVDMAKYKTKAQRTVKVMEDEIAKLKEAQQKSVVDTEHEQDEIAELQEEVELAKEQIEEAKQNARAEEERLTRAFNTQISSMEQRLAQRQEALEATGQEVAEWRSKAEQLQQQLVTMGSKMAVEDKKFNGGSAGDGWENGGTKDVSALQTRLHASNEQLAEAEAQLQEKEAEHQAKVEKLQAEVANLREALQTEGGGSTIETLLSTQHDQPQQQQQYQSQQQLQQQLQQQQLSKGVAVGGGEEPDSAGAPPLPTSTLNNDHPHPQSHPLVLQYSNAMSARHIGDDSQSIMSFAPSMSEADLLEEALASDVVSRASSVKGLGLRWGARGMGGVSSKEEQALRQKMAQLEEEVEELQQEMTRREQLEGVLKSEIREMERDAKRSERTGQDLVYLKNIVLQLYQTGQGITLLPVIAQLLHFSPEEVLKCEEALEGKAVANSGAEPQTQQSLLTGFSRWAFGGS